MERGQALLCGVSPSAGHSLITRLPVTGLPFKEETYLCFLHTLDRATLDYVNLIYNQQDATCNDLYF